MPTSTREKHVVAALGTCLAIAAATGCGDLSDVRLLGDTSSSGDPGPTHVGATSGGPGDDGSNTDALSPPAGAQQVLEQQSVGPQRIYVNFDGPRIDDCTGYCSDAPTNRSWAIGAHFGTSSIDFAPYGDAAGRQAVLDELGRAFGPYDVEITTNRPSAGPYTMLVVSPTTGPHHGVAPLDCSNNNPDDIAFVYNIGSSSPGWVAQAAAHELGHSFGLAHVTGSGDYMHWDSSGDAFTRATWDSARSNANCFDGSVQDAPALLLQALGARGSHPTSCDRVDRLAGSGRHATAAAVSRALFPDGADVAVLTRDSDENPDALTAGPLAHHLGGPLLLTATSTLPQATSDELARLGASTVYVVGGTGAVSPTVTDELRRAGYQVHRLAGSSRYATAAAVARAAGAPSSGLAFIASGESGHLVDALAAAGPAGALGASILLVTRQAIPAETAQAIDDLGITQTVIVGGEASIGPDVEQQLPRPTRIAGSDRFATAVAIADYARNEGVPVTDTYVSRADVMPDALAAGAAGGVLVLSQSDDLPAASRTFLQQNATAATLLGGMSALDARVESQVCDSLK